MPRSHALERQARTPLSGALSHALARFYLPATHALVSGNDCTLLRDGGEAFPAMLEAIRSAQRTIHLETYMFLADSVGARFSEALGEAAERGVQVKVLYDALGSWTSGRAFFDRMRARGVDVRAFNPLSLRRLRRAIRRDHRKILVVDESVAFIGGINISDHWAPEGQGQNWRDDVLRICGPAVVALERHFTASWRLMAHERLRQLHRLWRLSPPRPCGSTVLSVLASRRSIHRAYVHAIRRARRSVFVVAGYFIPDRRLVSALREAAQRGVEVSLVLSGRSDHPMLMHATRAFYVRLLEAGVRIHEWRRTVLHAKTAVVDGVWGTVGSYNLERMSMLFNHEANVFFADPVLGRRLEESFREDCALCWPVELQAFQRRPLWQKALERVLYFFRKLL
ncbi:MAG: phospholipase D-like domain-containing protein [Myxococcaceae bacterium]|nr:phospholipase D-like domain-containing protein [Myxococcaceae bacterium]